MNLIERFESKIMPEPNTGCWIWMDFLSYKGYGQFWVNGKFNKAHRFSYELYKSEIPVHKLVCHSCDNPSCVNPDYLFIGTNQDNMNDRNNKNRQAIGEKIKKKLTIEKVRLIKQSLKNGVSEKELSLSFGVSQGNINYIKNNKIWSHVHG